MQPDRDFVPTPTPRPLVEGLETRLLFSGHRPAFKVNDVAPLGPAVTAGDTQLKQYIVLHEGDRLIPYLDDKGLLTVGVGSNIDPDQNAAAAVAKYKVLTGNATLSTKKALQALHHLKSLARPSNRKPVLPPFINASQDAALFQTDLTNAIADAQQIVDSAGAGTFAALNHRQQVACVDLDFNMGHGDGSAHGFSSLSRFRTALAGSHWRAAGNALARAAMDLKRKGDDLHFIEDVLDHFDFSPSSPSVASGDTASITPTPKDWEGNDISLDDTETFVWSSSDPTIALLVDPNAQVVQVRGAKAGTSRLTLMDAKWQLQNEQAVTIQVHNGSPPPPHPYFGPYGPSLV